MPRPSKDKRYKTSNRTKPPVVLDKEGLSRFLEQREKELKNAKYKYKPNDVEREYLLKMLDVFEKRMSTYDISEEKPKNNRRGEPCKYTPRQVFDNIMAYFRISIMYDQPLTKSGIASFNNMDRDWIDANRLKVIDPAFSFINDCLDFVEFYMEYTGQKKHNPAFQIFWLKNRGWVDKIELSTSTSGALTDAERKEAQKRISQFSEKEVKKNGN
jgi:hypothetical protein